MEMECNCRPASDASPRIASYRGEGSLPAWLRRVAAHIAIDRGRPRTPSSQRGHAGSSTRWSTQGVKIVEISLCYGIDRSTAYRQLRRAEQRVRRDVFDAVRKKTGLSSVDEVSALLRPACEQVNVAPNVWDVPAG